MEKRPTPRIPEDEKGEDAINLADRISRQSRAPSHLILLELEEADVDTDYSDEPATS